MAPVTSGLKPATAKRLSVPLILIVEDDAVVVETLTVYLEHAGYDVAAAREFARLDARAEAVAAAFWPGPLTLVLPLRDGAGLSPLVTAGLDTVAIRVPAHPLARALLRAFGGPLAAPSANPSGKVSPTRAAHVRAGLSGRI